MQQSRTKKSRAFTYAIALHVMVLAILITSTDMASDPNPAPLPAVPIVKARVVDQRAIDAEVKRLEAQETKKRREEEKKVAEIKKKRRAEEQKLNALKKEQARLEKKKADEKKRIAAEKKQLEKEKRLLAERKQTEEQEQKRIAAEKVKAEQELQRIADQRRELEEEKAREEAEALRQALANEETERALAGKQRADDLEIARYINAVRTKVASVFIYPDLAEGLKCTLYVRMIPGGEVIEARVIQPSGNATFDRQAENAVRKAAPLPVPSDPRLFQRMREIKFVFDPE